MATNKKTASNPGSPTTRAATGSDTELIRLLVDVQQKVNSSPALNGGFDTLLYKVDKIEESQGKIVSTVDAIHTAIYAPDEGLFSRIASVKASGSEERAELEKQLIEFNAWKQQTDKAVTEHLHDEELTKKVETQQKTIDDLTRWKSNVSAVIKWTAVAFGGGGVTLLFKVLYDVVLTHWK